MMISSCCLVVAEAEPAVALMVQGEESSWRMASAHERAAALPFNPALAYGAQAHAAALPACFMYYVSSLSTLFPSSTSPLMQAFSRTVEEEASKQRNATPHHHNCNFSQLAQHRFFKSLESWVGFFFKVFSLFLEPPFIHLFNKLIPQTYAVPLSLDYTSSPTHMKIS
jgi:hypothetical protein